MFEQITRVSQVKKAKVKVEYLSLRAIGAKRKDELFLL